MSEGRWPREVGAMQQALWLCWALYSEGDRGRGRLRQESDDFTPWGKSHSRGDAVKQGWLRRLIRGEEWRQLAGLLAMLTPCSTPGVPVPSVWEGIVALKG